MMIAFNRNCQDTMSNANKIILKIKNFIFPSHSKDHESGKHNWEIYSEWKNLWSGKICRKKFLGK